MEEGILYTVAAAGLPQGLDAQLGPYIVVREETGLCRQNSPALPPGSASRRSMGSRNIRQGLLVGFLDCNVPAGKCLAAWPVAVRRDALL